MLWNRVDIARNKIIKEVEEKGQKWTVSYSKGAHQTCSILQKFLNKILELKSKEETHAKKCI